MFEVTKLIQLYLINVKQFAVERAEQEWREHRRAQHIG